MTLQAYSNKRGVLLHPGDPFGFAPSALVTATIDAAGESAAVVGYINLSTGPGTSKTLSAAGGGKIHWYPGATHTFANATTRLRVGVNDVGATGLEDGTHDVYGELVGGTDTINANAIMRTAMGTGSKSISHGALVAIVIEMTARGGADSVGVNRLNLAPTVASPHGTFDTGSGPAVSAAGGILATIEFDDGTVGWLDNHVAYRRTTSTGYASNSTPDEYALVFTLPHKAIVSGLWALLSTLAATDDFELILYSDPLGTPVAERTITMDMDLAATGSIFSRPLSSFYTLAPNTPYAIALRPTTTNTLNFHILDFNTNGAVLRKATPLGTNWSMYSRTNQTGAFGSEVTTQLPQFGLWISDLSDDAGGATGGGPLVGGRLVA